MVYNGVTKGIWYPNWDAASNLPHSSWHVPGHLPYLAGDKEVTLSDLRNVPFRGSDAWINIFEDLDEETLWKLALREDFILRGVIDYFSARRAASLTANGVVWRVPQRVDIIGPDLLDSLPLELILYISKELHPADLCVLSHTSFSKRLLAADILKTRIKAALASFGLVHSHILLMQECTNTVITGPIIDYLTASAPCDASLDQISHLSFYIPEDESYWVEYYFSTYTTFRDSYAGGLPNFDESSDSCISNVRIMRNADEQQIRLVRCCSSNPLEALVASPYASRIACITHLGLWHAHPASAFSRVAIPNRMYVEVAYPQARAFAMVWIQDLQAAGYRLTSYYPRRHVCAQSMACPATLRVSTDRGCFNMFFEPHVGPSHAVHHYLPRVAWSLSSTACPPAATTSTSPLPTLDRKSALWAIRWEALVSAALTLAEISEHEGDDESSMTDDEGLD